MRISDVYIISFSLTLLTLDIFVNRNFSSIKRNILNILNKQCLIQFLLKISRLIEINKSSQSH